MIQSIITKMISSTSQNVSDKSDMMSSLMNKTSLMSQGGTPGSKVDSDPGGETYKIISKLDFLLFWHDHFLSIGFPVSLYLRHGMDCFRKQCGWSQCEDGGASGGSLNIS